MVLAALGFAGWKSFSKPAAPDRPLRFQVELPPDVQFSEYVSLSPDGRKLLFHAGGAKGGLWLRDLETLEWRHVDGTDANTAGPTWSSDGRFLSFASSGQMKKIELTGGPPVTLTIAPAIGSGSWSPDGSIIIFGGAGSGPIRRIPSSGGIAQDVTAVDDSRQESFHALPVFLPDGSHFLYLRGGPPDVQGIYAGSLDLKPGEQPKNRILASNYGVSYINGKLFFVRDTALMVQPFDANKLQLSGEPIPLADHIGSVRVTAMFAVSKSGVLAYRQTNSAGYAAPVHAWYDRSGKLVAPVPDEGDDYVFTISPDAHRAVTAARTVRNGARDGLWLFDFGRRIRTRLTFQQDVAFAPVWTRDNRKVYYSLNGAIFEKDVDGAGQARQLYSQSAPVEPTSITPDSRFLIYHNAAAASDVFALPLQGDPKPAVL
ncbi:MAG: TolB family protein, partial [Bryobacteraceae bacterium]